MISSGVEPFIEQQWDAALRHAGEAGEDTYLLACPGAAVKGCPSAVSYPVDVPLEADAFLQGELLAEANLTHIRSKHRVAVFEDVDEDDPTAMAVLLGLLRHEVEHVRQRKCHGQELFELDNLAQALVDDREKHEGNAPIWYRRKPIERAANTAAARLLTESCPEHLVVLANGPYAPLTQLDTQASRVENLPYETVRFMYGLVSSSDEPLIFDDGLAWEERLEERWAGAGAWWAGMGTMPFA
jgi:hypothetical protein